MAIHAGIGLVMGARPQDPQRAAGDEAVALVWTEPGEGAGDPTDSSGAAAALSPQAAVSPGDPPAEEPEAEAAQAIQEAAPPSELETADPPTEGETAAMPAADADLPLPPPIPPRRPPARPAAPARQASASALEAARGGMIAEAPPSAAGGIEVLGPVRPPRQMGGFFNAPPAYPAASRLRNEQGRVTLMVEIDAAGQMADAAIQVSAGYPALDRAALEAVRAWRFEPAMRDGQPVHFTGPLHITFQLEGGLRW
ncbi:MAG TPA: energy transducer TonB [Falsiroseomonas sp.]|nr:energy transducer TonB [Falsiroseomonas sp.]